mmetsp:Transcript_137311/g.325238  ORF Transcript_137311/g.325238 Transcript_137311/m.325238 type:complete len:240 (-) Transcript_137311:1089-1808(-)
MALEIKLYISCVHLYASASMTGKVLLTELINFTPWRRVGTPRLSTACWQRSTTSSMMLASCTGSLVIPISGCLAKRDASIMLLTMSSSRIAELLIMARGFLAPLVVDSSSRSEWLRPMMPCNGDLSSCETMAIMEDFQSSMSFSFVMSCPMQIAPVGLPLLSTRVVAFTRSVTLAVSRVISKTSVRLCSSDNFTIFVTFRRQLAQITEMSLSPKTCILLSPDASTSQRFHSVMQQSMPT